MHNLVNGFGFGTQGQKELSHRSVELFYQNVRGLRTKLDMFRNSVEVLGSDLFAITESGCNNSIEDAEIVPPGYQILRCDRSDGRKHGGTFFIASHRFELRQVLIPNVSVDACSFEIVCATVHLMNKFLFMCSIFYIREVQRMTIWYCLA